MILVPVTYDHFRFMNLPPEIRTMIYGLLLTEEAPVQIRTRQTNGRHQRPVRESFLNTAEHKSYDKDSKTGKWIGMDPSSASIIRTSRIIHIEAAPILYGTNSFFLGQILDLGVFLNTIGKNRKYIKQMRLLSTYGKSTSRKVETAMEPLGRAIGLRLLQVHHDMFCHQSCADLDKEIMKSRVEAFKPHLRQILAVKEDRTVQEVVDMIQVTWQKCGMCSDGNKCGQCSNSWSGRIKCNNAAAHCDAIGVEFRKMLTEALRA